MLEVASFRVCLCHTCDTDTQPCSQHTPGFCAGAGGHRLSLDPLSPDLFLLLGWVGVEDWAACPLCFLPPSRAACGVLTRSLLMAAGQVHEQCGEA